MSRHVNSLIIEDGLYCQSTVHCKVAHHRDFPDIRVECGTVTDAIDRLASEFTRARDSAVSDCQREAINQVLSDITDYRESLIDTDTDAELTQTYASQTAKPTKLSV